MSKLVAIALVAASLVGCQQSAVDAAIARSSAPVLIPTGEWRSSFEFTAPPGSTDLYQFRWNFRPGATDLVAGWQINPSSTTGASMAEGPGSELIDEARRAAAGEGCDLVDTDVQLCTFPAEFARDGVNAYLVRTIGDHTLVLDYLNLTGDRTQYNPDALAATYIAADFEPVPIDGTTDDYLTSFR